MYFPSVNWNFWTGVKEILIQLSPNNSAGDSHGWLQTVVDWDPCRQPLLSCRQQAGTEIGTLQCTWRYSPFLLLAGVGSFLSSKLRSMLEHRCEKGSSHSSQSTSKDLHPNFCCKSASASCVKRALPLIHTALKDHCVWRVVEPLWKRKKTLRVVGLPYHLFAFLCEKKTALALATCICTGSLPVVSPLVSSS